MLLLMLAAGGYFSVRTGFFQVRKAGHWLRRTIFSKGSRTASEGAVSPFQAMSAALAATLGTGNIAGVAAALSAGGAGAVFWMWVSAVLGMMTGYAENVLGTYYRRKNRTGGWSGGAMYYIRDGLAEKRFSKRLAKPLASVFAGACVLSAFGMGNLAQMNSAAQAMKSGFGVPAVVTGCVLAAVAAFIFFGGNRRQGRTAAPAMRIARVTELLVPLMSAMYIAGSVFILGANITRIPEMFGVIIRGAFVPEAASGGVSGYMIKQAVSMGFRRGVFSNEAGLGTSVAAHVGSDVAEPCVQGMWSIFEVFFDTIVMCSMTAFVLLASPCRAVSQQEAFMNVTLQPQYFRLTEQEGLISSGTALLTAGSGEPQRFRSVTGDEFTVDIARGEPVCSNVMKLTGVQAEDSSGRPLFRDNSETIPMISGVVLEEVTGVELVSLAFSTVFGGAAGKLLSAAVVLFAFSTVIGWSSFGSEAAVFLFGSHAGTPFRALFTICIAVGAVVDISAAWGVADFFNGLMAAVNLPVVLCLSGTVLRLTRNYSARTFRGARIKPELSADPFIQSEQERKS
ncbi:MAG: alanine/glycine:cation symporter family protein [Oscillospiraceae bacterium]